MDFLINYINGVITYIGDKLDKVNDVLPQLTKTRDGQKVVIFQGYRGMFSPVVVNLSDTLWSFLGFDARSGKRAICDHLFHCFKRINRRQKIEKNNLVMINNAHMYFDIQPIRSLYIYSDIVMPSFVGHSYSQLLRVCEVSSVDRYSKQITIRYNNPYYIPVSQNKFNLIKIDIKDDTGSNIAFQYGSVIVTLEFKRKE